MQPAKFYRSLLLQVIALSVVLEFLLVYQSGFNLNTSALDALITAVSLALCIWVASISVCKYPTKAGLVYYAFLIGAACGAASWYLDRLLLQWLLDDGSYLHWLKATQWEWLIFFGVAGAWTSTHVAQKRKTTVLEQQFKELTDAATLHREAELFKLRQQLQPHFLYNSLNSISALIMIEPEQAQEMIGKLSDFLRNSVKREGKEAIPVSEELDYIEAYLAIEAVRFGDRLQIVYDRNFTDAATIPPFLLQPILENAIKFGLYGNTGHVVIHMHIELITDQLRIVITNPYEDMHRPPSGTGFGLQGIRRRLYLIYGRTDLLETAQDNGLFTTTLTIPQTDVQSNPD